jgi:23S rRNA pseudouridine1911/1915/1917 synthase
LELDIRTGRTHQIRVHCKTMGHPVIGDPVYGNRGDKNRMTAASAEMGRTVATVGRQMLHAWRLSFLHPATGMRMNIKAPLPSDMSGLIVRFRNMSATMKIDADD